MGVFFLASGLEYHLSVKITDMNDHQLPDAPTLKLGKYRHYKGNEYEVIGLGTHTETGEELVVYRALYGEGQLWIRPLTMFLETVIVEGVEKPRFAYMGGE
jgi:hypothetical protein